VERGVLLQQVVPGGPADSAGLRGSTGRIEEDDTPLISSGDIIVALDGLAVGDMDDLIVLLSEKTVGQTITLTFVRDGEEQSLEVTLGERPGS
jgi:2-alkenal reductase